MSASEARLPATSTRSELRPARTKPVRCHAVPARPASCCGRSYHCAETCVESAPGSSVMPSYRLQSSCCAVRRVANTQVSVEPNISSSGARRRVFDEPRQRRIERRGGADDEIDAPGKSSPDSASARRCNGVLTSTRGRGGCASAAGHIRGKQRPLGVHAHAGEQRQQHRELDAIHVMRRHRADDRQRRVRRQSQRGTDGGGIQPGAVGQRAPAFGVRPATCRCCRT